MTQIIFQPIGLIHSPFQEPQGTPVQPLAARDVAGVVEILPEFAAGLQDLEGFSRLILVYHFHLARTFTLRVKPFLDEKERGVFATRAPARPCPIGLSVVRLDKIEENRLLVRDVDVVNNTPLLDIKPYVPQFDSFPDEKIGWLMDKIGKLRNAKDDGRFVK